MNDIAVSASFLPHNEEEFIKIMEFLSRCCVGLGLDGISSTISITDFEDEEYT